MVKNMKYNLHTHSFYCGHGEGSIIEYAEYAESKGFDILGFSEHCPFPDNRFHSTRMDYSQLGNYLNDVDQATSGSSITILKGFECDYFPEFKSYFEDLRESADYLITGTHFMVSDDRISNPFDPGMTRDDLFIYADSAIKAMESGLFSFVCHPDVYLSHYPFDADARAVARDIITLSNELGLPLEINANGIAKAVAAGLSEYGYPNKNFWKLAEEMEARCIMSSDAHTVENLDKYSDRLKAFAEQYTLKMAEPAVTEENGRKKISFI